MAWNLLRKFHAKDQGSIIATKNMNTTMVQRITANIILLMSVLFAPWWITIILALALVFYFKLYYEFIIAAVITDMLYGVPEVLLFDWVFVYTAFSIILFILVQWLKTRLR